MNNFPKKLSFVLAIFSVLVLTASVVANEPVTVEQAIEQLDATISQSGLTDPEAVQEAAAVLAFALESAGVQTAEGHLALANAYFIGEDLGRAITHYRKGLAIDPHHPVLKANLSHARSFVEPTLPSESESITFGSVLLYWQHLLSTQTMWLTCIGLAAFASLTWTAMILFRRISIPKLAPITCASLAALGLFLLGYAEYQSKQAQSAVVSAPGTLMYSGPGTGVYQEVYEGALGIGTEAQVFKIDGQWAKILLGNKQEGWIDANALLFINDTKNDEDPRSSS